MERTTSPGLSTSASGQLERRIGPLLLTLYGIGVMVGAGIYVLVGAVAGRAGVFAPLAFLAAGVIAAPTALSYAELSVRVPESSGEAAFVRRAFGRDGLSLLIGTAIVGVGVTSAAAVLRGGVGYVNTFTDVDPKILITMIGAAIMVVAIWGTLESLTIAALFTIAEIGGLLVVAWVGLSGPASTDWVAIDVSNLEISGLGFATVLAFFAFIGFEDMVNMVEEVKRPGRTMPVAIITSLAVTCVLYGLVSVAAVRAVDVGRLSASDSPLALVYETATGANPRFLSAIAVLAALNGVLAQVVMATRMLFGLGRRHRRLAMFSVVDRRFGTPLLATVMVGVAVVVGALVVDVEALAEVTSSFLLVVFVIVNSALLQMKRRSPSPGFSAPSWGPVVGLVGSALALVVSLIP